VAVSLQDFDSSLIQQGHQGQSNYGLRHCQKQKVLDSQEKTSEKLEAQLLSLAPPFFSLSHNCPFHIPRTLLHLKLAVHSALAI
jgi:hypothetical protein